MKGNLVVRSSIMANRFDQKSFSRNIPGFTPHWDYSCYIKNTGQKVILDGLAILDEVHLKLDCLDGSVVNGSREHVLFSFVFEKPHAFKIFCEPQTKPYKKATFLF